MIQVSAAVSDVVRPRPSNSRCGREAKASDQPIHVPSGADFVLLVCRFMRTLRREPGMLAHILEQKAVQSLCKLSTPAEHASKTTYACCVYFALNPVSLARAYSEIRINIYRMRKLRIPLPALIQLPDRLHNPCPELHLEFDPADHRRLESFSTPLPGPITPRVLQTPSLSFHTHDYRDRPPRIQENLARIFRENDWVVWL